MEQVAFPKKRSIFNHAVHFEKPAQDNSNLYVALTWLEAGARYFLWQITAASGRFFFFLSPTWIKDETSAEVQMSAVQRGQLRALCAAAGADLQPTSLSASQPLSARAAQSA